MTGGDCPRCSNPLPLDGVCDCAGGELDAWTELRGMQPHAMLVRLGPDNSESDTVVEMWV